MERVNQTSRMDLVSRPVASGLAVLVTALLFTSTTVILTAGARYHTPVAGQVAAAQAQGSAEPAVHHRVTVTHKA